MKKYFTFIKIISVLLIVILTLPYIISCGGSEPETSNDKNNDNDNTPAEQADNAETEENRIESATPAYTLPEADYGGYEFTILGVEATEATWFFNRYSEMYSETENSDIINDAIYRRTVEIEDLYNIKFSKIEKPREQTASEALKYIRAGDAAFDAVFLTGMTIPTIMTVPNALVDLNEVPSLELDNPWWDKNSISGLSIGNKTYCVGGDLNFRSLFGILCVGFNKAMIADYALEDPYSLVRSGNWTLDKMHEMSKAVTRDSNGDGVINGEDIVGYYSEDQLTADAFISMGESFVKKDRDDIPELSARDARKNTIIEKLVDFYGDKSAVFTLADFTAQYSKDVPSGQSIQFAKLVPNFIENKVLFINMCLGNTLNYREMQMDFGILPFPKLDSAQEKYAASMHWVFMSLTAIPSFNENLERTGTILNAMSYLSNQYIIPSIYDVTITNKLLRDEDSREMIDLMYNNKPYDMGFTYDWGGIRDTLNTLVRTLNPNYSSAIEKKEDAIKLKMNAAIEQLFTE